ncbi:hypothetical protein [Streptomyces sp. 2224.1]|uniref:hypothetical protein n=1 Tax=Streptomyces sp. 2224.1 TaxID=1881020 RepID=UPI003525A323
MSLDAASAELGWLGPKLSRIETANGHIRPPEIAPLLKVYGVTDPDVVSALEGLAKDARKQGWWQTYSGIVAPAYADYISLESDAESVRIWTPYWSPDCYRPPDTHVRRWPPTPPPALPRRSPRCLRFVWPDRPCSPARKVH